jgi:hypothetical protein
VEGLNLLLKNAGEKWHVSGALATTAFKELTPEERLALEGVRTREGEVWKTWKEKHSQRQVHHELKSAEDATMDAEKVANTIEWSKRLKELSAQIETLQPVMRAVGKTGAYVCEEEEEEEGELQQEEDVSMWDAMQEDNLKRFDDCQSDDDGCYSQAQGCGQVDDGCYSQAHDCDGQVDDGCYYDELPQQADDYYYCSYYDDEEERSDNENASAHSIISYLP